MGGQRRPKHTGQNIDEYLLLLTGPPGHIPVGDSLHGIGTRQRSGQLMRTPGPFLG